MSEGDDTTELIDNACKQFAEVRKGMDGPNKSLQYILSVESLTSALSFIDTPEAFEFAKEFLLKMITLLLAQLPNKVGIPERPRLEESLSLAIRIAVKYLPREANFINVVLKIFDSTQPYYAGIKVGYTYFNGYASVRVAMARLFAEIGGYSLYLDILRKPDHVWTGANTTQLMLKSLQDATTCVPTDVKDAILSTSMKQLLALTDEQLKKESSEALTHIINTLRCIGEWQRSTTGHLQLTPDPAKLVEFYQFWFDLTLRLMTSSSIVLKLTCWEFVQELVILSLSSRPAALAYLVQGAGTDFVNGEYRYSEMGDNNTRRFVKVPEPGHAQVAQPLTLFRCKMQNNCRYWYISQPGKLGCGQSDDVDYYNLRADMHCALPEPSMCGWSSNLVEGHLIGADPAPLVKRLGSLLGGNGDPKEFVLAGIFCKWVHENNIIRQIFGTSMHREIVSRSVKLMTFLAEYDQITAQDLAMVWKAAVQCNDSDIVEEVFGVLASMTSQLSEDLLICLIGLATNCLTVHEDSSVGLSKVVQFIDKFVRNNFYDIERISSEKAAVEFTGLVWRIFRSPGVETSKNYGSIQEILSKCLQRNGSRTAIVAYAKECTVQLQEFNDSSTRPVPKTVDSTVARIVQVLLFLVSKHFNEFIATELWDKETFTEAIVNDMARLLRGAETTKPAQLTLDLSSRLMIIRQFHGFSHNIRIPLPQIKKLWEMLSPHQVGCDQFFAFLRSGCSHDGRIQPFCTQFDMLTIFRLYICNSGIDWSKCSDNAFQCFSNYFSELKDNHTSFPMGTDLPPSLGLSTLWRIALHIPTESNFESAVNLLLNAYEELSTSSSSSVQVHQSLLSEVFSRLDSIIQATATSDDKLSDNDNVTVTRCVGILTESLRRYKGPQPELSHIVRGCRQRMQLKVFYRKATFYYNHHMHMDVYNTIKGSEGVISLDVHPMHTAKQVKEKIMHEKKDMFHEIGYLSLEFQKKVLEDSNRLGILGMIDGSEASACYALANSFNSKNFPGDTHGTFSTGECGLDSDLNVGLMISSNIHQFQSLLSLCQRVNNDDIWNLLMLIPTQKEILEEIYLACVNYGEDSTLDWDVLLCDSPFTRSAYVLQVVDHLLQPSPDAMNKSSSFSIDSTSFKDGFLRSGGFKRLVTVFVNSSASENMITKTAQSVALHMIHSLLFLAHVSSDDSCLDDETMNESQCDISQQCDTHLSIASDLLEDLQKISDTMVEKLLIVAGQAAASAQEEIGVVQHSLAIITLLLTSSEVASRLIANPQSKVLLATVLRSESSKVRGLAANFAIQFGKSQPIVFDWLLSELEVMNAGDLNCADIFRATKALLVIVHSGREMDGSSCLSLQRLAACLCHKLAAYPRDSRIKNKEVLFGQLDLLSDLIVLDVNAVRETDFAKSLLNAMIKDFLFTMPSSDDENKSPICDTPETRQAAYNVMASYLQVSKESIDEIILEVSQLAHHGNAHISQSWELRVSHDVKKDNIEFSGLKNQGCTCYMNSLLQTLFMSPSIREAVLNTPLLESHRSTIWHISNQELVGCLVLLQWQDCKWKRARVIGYNDETEYHCIEYLNNDDKVITTNTIKLHENTYTQENGEIRLISRGNANPQQLCDASAPQLSESEDAAQKVLEQLQRTFCFMKYSKRRYFDPRPLVDACKTLNMNYNVYHQNDAAEFCDQLLDRIETATKGKHTKVDMWGTVFQKEIFGGQWQYQKIPTECEVYQTDKKECGHWRSSRLESFLKVELLVRGKEAVEDSLKDLVQGELMDGDNKIDCDVCMEKKATVRRTCFGTLPNTMLLHLKRFDLDYQTFETVKLNNRMAFPTHINMLKYTKEGMEYEDRLQQKAKAEAAQQAQNEAENSSESSSKGGDSSGLSKGGTSSSSIQYDQAVPDIVVPDSADYEYELHAVLVHSGIAQGGHYYSFARDPENPENWFRLEDEDVSPFNSDQLPLQCYGGPSNSGTSTSGMNTIDDDRHSNALMLFYNKVKPHGDEKQEAAGTKPTDSSSELPVPTAAVIESVAESAAESAGSDRLVTGYEAFQNEVRQSNVNHILSCYLLDSDLHAFVRKILNLTAASSNSEPSLLDEEQAQRTIQFATSFLLDIVLHCRERSLMKAWVEAFQLNFEQFPKTAAWFLLEVVHVRSSLLMDYFVYCTDSMSRLTFVQLLMAAVHVLIPKHSVRLQELSRCPEDQVMLLCSQGDAEALCLRLIHMVRSFIFDIPRMGARNSDELFVMIRELASIPCICQFLLENNILSILCYFVSPDVVHINLKNQFSQKNTQHSRQNQNSANYTKPEYSTLFPGILEAIAALIGVPQIRRMNLLEDTSYWDYHLVPQAREALSTIFMEHSHNGGMGPLEISHYMEKIAGTGSKPTQIQVKQVLEKFHPGPDGRLSLQGFLEYYTEQASYFSKIVWRDLYALGFRNDLTRASAHAPDDASPAQSLANLPQLQAPSLCMLTLSNGSLFEQTIEVTEEVTKAVANRLCYNNEKFSVLLIRQYLKKLYSIVQANSWSGLVKHYVEFLVMLLRLDDRLQLSRLREILLNQSFGLLTVIAKERINEFDQNGVFRKYVDFVQELTAVANVRDLILQLAAHDEVARAVKPFLRLKPGAIMTEDDEMDLKSSVMSVTGAGQAEVNGLYTFKDMKEGAGFFEKIEMGSTGPIHYTMYKCAVSNGGGVQWFLSITPAGHQPGTPNDTDFYFAPASMARPEYWPPVIFQVINKTSPYGVPPQVRRLRPGDLQEEEEEEAGVEVGAHRVATPHNDSEELLDDDDCEVLPDEDDDEDDVEGIDSSGSEDGSYRGSGILPVDYDVDDRVGSSHHQVYGGSHSQEQLEGVEGLGDESFTSLGQDDSLDHIRNNTYVGFSDDSFQDVDEDDDDGVQYSREFRE